MNYPAAVRRVIWRPPEELSYYRQKSYLATTKREELSGGRQKSYLAAAIYLSGGRQKSYEGQSKLLSSF